MVILHKEKLVWISIPKCGTHAISNILVEQFDGERIIPPYHPRDIPDTAKGYRTFTVSRNPYNRAISIWYHLLHRTTQAIKPLKSYGELWGPLLSEYFGVKRDDLDLNHVLEFLASREWEKHKDKSSWVVCQPQVEWLEDVRIDEICQLENLERDLENKFQMAMKEMPNAVVRFKAPYKRPQLTHDQRRLIEEWAREDFIEFEYDRIV